MVEHALEAAYAVDLDDAWFWDATPYLTVLAVGARRKARFRLAVIGGWWSAGFERTDRLPPIDTLFDPAPADLDEKTAEAEFMRMAASMGLEVEDVSDESDDPHA